MVYISQNQYYKDYALCIWKLILSEKTFILPLQ